MVAGDSVMAEMWQAAACSELSGLGDRRSSSLFPTRCHLLNIPPPPETPSPAGDRMFKDMSQWGAYHIQTITLTNTAFNTNSLLTFLPLFPFSFGCEPNLQRLSPSTPFSKVTNLFMYVLIKSLHFFHRHI